MFDAEKYSPLAKSDLKKLYRDAEEYRNKSVVPKLIRREWGVIKGEEKKGKHITAEEALNRLKTQLRIIIAESSKHMYGDAAEVQQRRIDAKNTEAYEELLEVFDARRIADSVARIALYGKPTPLEDHEPRERSSLYYQRSVRDKVGQENFTKTSQNPFQFDWVWEADALRMHAEMLARGGPKFFQSPPGEVTIRFAPGSNKTTERLVFIVSLVYKNTLDPRWSNYPSYFVFDLSGVDAKTFLEHALKNPAFVKKLLQAITKQELENFTEPTQVVCSAVPELTGLDLQDNVVRDDGARVDFTHYRGMFVVSNGTEVTQYSTVGDRQVAQELFIRGENLQNRSFVDFGIEF